MPTKEQQQYSFVCEPPHIFTSFSPLTGLQGANLDVAVAQADSGDSPVCEVGGQLVKLVELLVLDVPGFVPEGPPLLKLLNDLLMLPPHLRYGGDDTKLIFVFQAVTTNAMISAVEETRCI